MEIKCVSGFSFTARKWVIKDRRLLANRRLAKGGRFFTTMLERAALEVTNPGPYSRFMKPGDKPNFSGVAWPDIMDALLQIRQHMNDQIDFSETCQADGCSAPLRPEDHHTLSSLKRQPPSQRGLRFLETGEPIGFSFRGDAFEGGGVDIYLKVIRGEDIPTMFKWQGERQRAAALTSDDGGAGRAADAMVCLQIDKVVIPASGKVLEEMDELLEWYGEQDWELQSKLEELVDELTGGVDTTLGVECPACGHYNELPLPFDMHFFYPKKMESSTLSVSEIGSTATP